MGQADQPSPAEGALATVRGRILDEASGQPLAARVSIRAGGGQAVGTLYPRWPGFWADGSFEAKVPPGPVVVAAQCGPEYWHFSRPLELAPGEQADVEIALRCWVDMPARGWYAGDNHLHPIHGEREYEADLARVALAARAEGLRYASAAQSWGRRYTLRELEAECRRLSGEQFTLWWNLEYPKTSLGHAWFLLAQSFEGMTGEPADYEGHARVRAGGGLVCIAHPLRWWMSEGKFVTNMASELPFDLAAGPTFDAIEVMYDAADDVQAQQLWFMLLDMGYRLPGLASSDTCLDRPAGPIPGRRRVYTRVEGGFSLKAVAQAMRRGRNFVTSGPLLLFDIGGHWPGAELPADGRPVEAHIEAFCSGDPNERLTQVQLIRNGEVAQAWDATERQATLRYTIRESEDAWYVVKCKGKNPDQAALANPIYFRTPGFKPPEAVRTRLHVSIKDQESGQPMNAHVTILDPLGAVLDERQAPAGQCELTVPPTSSIRVSAQGHQPVTKSIFRDTPLRTLVDEIASGSRQEKPLLEPFTYQRFRDLASEQALAFVLGKGE